MPLIAVFVLFAVYTILSFISDIIAASEIGNQIALLRSEYGYYYSSSELELSVARLGMALAIISIIVVFAMGVLCVIGAYQTNSYGSEYEINKLIYVVVSYFILAIIQMIFALIIAGEIAKASEIALELGSAAIAQLIFVILGSISSLVSVYCKANYKDYKKSFFALLVTCVCWLICLIINSVNNAPAQPSALVIIRNIVEYLVFAAVTLFSIYFVMTYTYASKKKVVPIKVATPTEQPQPQPQPQQNQSNKDIVTQLEALKSLRDKDILTEEEYQEKRKKLVDKL